MKKLAIVTSHPIQYNAPFFRLLRESKYISSKVFYTWEHTEKGAKYDPDFGREIQWDIPLLEGYDYTFVKNTAPAPGTHHFKGLINPTLNREIADWGPDAVLVYGWSFDSHLRCLRHFHKKLPVIFRGDSTLLDVNPGLKKQLRWIFLRWVYRHVDYALYTGVNNREYFLEYGLKEGQLVHAPHAIDNERFAEPDALYRQQAGEWREQLRIADSDLVILFAGKLEPKKNPFFLVELLQRVTDKELKIIFVGNGVLETELKQAAAGDPRAIFLDFQNQRRMPVVYRLADVFALPSQGPGETWGLGANEAMASGCAVMLSSKTGGAIDLVKDGGIIFNATDLDLCTAFIRRILEDRTVLAGMKAASRERIKTFSYDRMVKAIESIL